MARYGGDVHNMSPTLLPHLWKHCLDHMDRTVEIGIEDLEDFLMGGFFNGPRYPDTGIVYKNIQTSFPCNEIGNRTIHTFHVLHVQGEQFKCIEIRMVVKVPRSTVNLVSLGGQIGSDGFAYAGGTPGDQYNFFIHGVGFRE